MRKKLSIRRGTSRGVDEEGGDLQSAEEGGGTSKGGTSRGGTEGVPWILGSCISRRRRLMNHELAVA